MKSLLEVAILLMHGLQKLRSEFSDKDDKGSFNKASLSDVPIELFSHTTQ